MNGRTVLGVVGVSLVLVALAGGGVPVSALVSALGNDYFLVAGLACVAVLASAPVIASGRSRNLVQAELPSPEGPTTAPTAGSSFDDLLADRTLAVPVLGRAKRRAVQERLRTAAVEAVMHRESCSREAARERVERGEWTDDDAAAAFLAGETGALAAFRTRRDARRAAEAVVEYADDGREGRR